LDVARSAENDPTLSRCRFVFVGGTLSANESEDDYRRPNTHVTGMVSHDLIARYLAASDIVVFPDITRPGSFTTATAEVMAAGVPMIVGTGPRHDLVPLEDQKSALLIPASDPAALHEALRRLVLDPELARSLGEEVGHYARVHMDYPRVAEQYLSIVDDVLAEMGKGAPLLMSPPTTSEG
jgi:glycosyltransferase involved in cell wall biosynthesis